MNISLTPELEEYVTRKVQSGRYLTASEVISASLQLLREQEEANAQKLTELRRDVALGIEQADQGKVAPLDAQQTLARVRQQRQDQARRT